MTIQEIIRKYLEAVEQGIKDDATSKNQKIPVSSFRVETSETAGALYGAHYLKYLAYGRGPGKAPPPDAMLKFVKSNPGIFTSAKRRFQSITEQGLAYLIGRKIAREGTDIFKGKKPGIDLKGAIEAPRATMLQELAYHEAVRVATDVKTAAMV